MSHLERYEQTVATRGKQGPDEELLAMLHELVHLIQAYEDAVSTRGARVPEEKLLTNKMLVKHLKQLRRALSDHAPI